MPKVSNDSRAARWRKYLPSLLTTRKQVNGKWEEKRPTQEEIDFLIDLGLQLDLDPVLGEIVLYRGRPYITEAGLMKKAIISGELDGLRVEAVFEDPDGAGPRWIATTTLFKKGCSQPFVFTADQFEYANPSSEIWRKNKRSMTEKCCTCKTIRHAFAISMCSYEEMAVDEVSGMSAAEAQAEARARDQEANGEEAAENAKQEQERRREELRRRATERLSTEQRQQIGALYRMLGLPRNGEGGSAALFHKTFPNFDPKQHEDFLTRTQAVGYIRDLWLMLADKIITEFQISRDEIAAIFDAELGTTKDVREILDEQWPIYIAALKQIGVSRLYEQLGWDDQERAEHFALHFADKPDLMACSIAELDSYISELRAVLNGDAIAESTDGGEKQAALL